ncbi:unnamed protein product [Symbiodinium sp. CCMP2592]|nr:unnamed protein product [Symbiodinium sp. CCMP2592]
MLRLCLIGLPLPQLITVRREGMWEAEIAVVLHLAFSVILLAIEVFSTSVVRTSVAAQRDQQLCCSGPSSESMSASSRSMIVGDIIVGSPYMDMWQPRTGRNDLGREWKNRGFTARAARSVR